MNLLTKDRVLLVCIDNWRVQVSTCFRFGRALPSSAPPVKVIQWSETDTHNKPTTLSISPLSSFKDLLSILYFKESARKQHLNSKIKQNQVKIDRGTFVSSLYSMSSCTFFNHPDLLGTLF